MTWYTALLTSVAEYYILFDFLHFMFKQKYKNKGINLAVCIFFVVFTVCFNMLSEGYKFAYNILGSITSVIGIPLLLFKGEIIDRIICGILFWLFASICEFVTFDIYGIIYHINTPDIKPETTFLLALCCMLTILFFTRALGYFINKIVVGSERKILYETLLLPFTTFLIFMGMSNHVSRMMENKAAFLFTGIGSILLFVVNVIIFHDMEKMSTLSMQKNLYEQAQTKARLNETHYKRLEEINEAHRQYKHNLKHYLVTIGSLAQENKDSEIIDILKELQVEADQIEQKIYTSDKILNALLCEKEVEAKQNGVSLKIDVEPGLNLYFITDFDKIALFGNLIDNAIEASEKCEPDQREVEIQIFESVGNFIMVCVENDYVEKIQRVGTMFFTQKDDADNHGIGVKNIQKIAEKYGGMMVIDTKDNHFTAQITLSRQ